MKPLWLAVAATLTLALAHAEPPLAVSGKVAAPMTLSRADLKAMPATTLTWAYTTRKHGDKKGTFTGALLWNVLAKAGLPSGDDRAYLRHVIEICGADGYCAAFAIGEIDPIYEGKPVLIAYRRDGEALNGLALVVPGDREGGRGVHDVVSIKLE